MKSNEHESALRDELNALSAREHGEIRYAYYKAVEGLESLAAALGKADSKQIPSKGPLLQEHLIVLDAAKAMERSSLGKLL